MAFASLLLMLANTPTVSTDIQAPGQAAASAKEAKICKMQTMVTGTRLGGNRRVCKTAKEWSRIEEEDEMGRVPFTRAVPPPPRPGPGNT